MIPAMLTLAMTLFNPVTSILYADYFYATFAERKSKTWWISLAAFVLFFLTPVLVKNKLINSAALVVYTFAVSFRYRMRFYNRILLTAVSVALNIIVEIATGFLFMLVFRIDFSLVKSGVYLELGTVFSKFAVFWIYYAIRFVRHRSLHGRFRKSWIGLFVLPVATTVMTYSLFLAMPDYSDDAVVLGTAGGLMLLVVANVLIFSLIDSISAAAEQENQLLTAKTLIKEQEEQYRLIAEKNDVVLKLRHDYKNTLTGMLADIEKNDVEAVRRQLTGQLGLLSANADETMSGNSVLDTVLRYKSDTARKAGVTIRPQFRNVHDIPIPSVDLSILLGNALDNAIEAASALHDQQQKTVDVFICVKGTQLNIKVTNFVEEDKDVTRLTSGKGGCHGYGIINMKSIAEKHRGTVTLTCRDRVFSTIILI